MDERIKTNEAKDKNGGTCNVMIKNDKLKDSPIVHILGP